MYAYGYVYVGMCVHMCVYVDGRVYGNVCVYVYRGVAEFISVHAFDYVSDDEYVSCYVLCLHACMFMIMYICLRMF